MIYALSRAKSLVVAGQGCSNLLEEVGGVTDSYGKRVDKLACLCEESMGLLELSCGSVASASNSSYSAIQCRLFHSALKSYSKQSQFFAATIKSSVSRPMFSDAISFKESSAKSANAYFSSRKDCIKCRSNALKARAKYLKSVAEAEAISIEVYRAAFKALSKTKERSMSGMSDGSVSAANESSQGIPSVPSSPQSMPSSPSSPPLGSAFALKEVVGNAGTVSDDQNKDAMKLAVSVWAAHRRPSFSF